MLKTGIRTCSGRVPFASLVKPLAIFQEPPKETAATRQSIVHLKINQQKNWQVAFRLTWPNAWGTQKFRCSDSDSYVIVYISSTRGFVGEAGSALSTGAMNLTVSGDYQSRKMGAAVVWAWGGAFGSPHGDMPNKNERETWPTCFSVLVCRFLTWNTSSEGFKENRSTWRYLFGDFKLFQKVLFHTSANGMQEITQTQLKRNLLFRTPSGKLHREHRNLRGRKKF